MFDLLQSRRIKLTLLAASLLVAGSALAAPTPQFTVTGAVTAPTTYDYASLQARPAVTQTVTYLSGTTPQTHTYTGASLWGVLDSAGIVTTAGIKNDIVNRYVLATGSDGYQTVFSLGELNPSFGNRGNIVAYAETVNGVSSPLTSDGFGRVTAPTDVKGGRYVSNLVDLDVRSSGSTQTGTGGGVSTQFSVTGAVSQATSFDLAALQGLPTITETFGGHTYVGVSFWDLLNTTVGIPVDVNVKNDVLSKYVVATGSDGYQTLFSMGELNPAFGNQPDMIAYEIDGASLGTNGFARLVVPNDGLKGRWVSNLVNLEVFSAAPVPEPQTNALMLAGLLLVGSAAAKRRGAALSTCAETT
jgi:DMSO/TMAO reductase YedYZ molybdopterin-dependent catalytic subunit